MTTCTSSAVVAFLKKGLVLPLGKLAAQVDIASMKITIHKYILSCLVTTLNFSFYAFLLCDVSLLSTIVDTALKHLT